ncbi:MAG: MOSC domain-containing protein [Chloroflexi bacterium]|nr:MOSC domain-containing protein [Chloroflexota bacterium]
MNEYPTETELQAAMAWIGQSPQDEGKLEMIVARPSVEQREVLASGQLDPTEGLVGDNWQVRGSKRTNDGSAHPDMQITLMNARAIQALTPDRGRWPLAGDQLFVDMDLTPENLPPGQQLAIGTALLEITAMPHTGCDKFTARFGHDAIRWVNSASGRQLRLRGIYAKVIQPWVIQVGDVIQKRAEKVA